MNDQAEPAPLPPPPPEAEPPSRSRWPRVWAALAWVIILGFVGWEALERYVLPEPPQAAARSERLGLVLMRTQARYIVGAHDAFPTSGMYEHAKALNTGPVAQRLRFVVLAGELRDPIEARQQLRNLDAALAKSRHRYAPAEAATRDRLDRLYRDYEGLHFRAPSLSPQDREQLRRSLGWFAELALAPDGRRFTERLVLPPAGVAAASVLKEDALPNPRAREEALAPARRTFWTQMAAFGSVCLLTVAGLAGLIAFLVLVFEGYVRGRFECGVTRGGVYAETFAVWLVLFKVIPLLAPLLPPEAPRLLLGVPAGLLSLVALAWPVLRGIPWRQVRVDIGLTAGPRPAVEPFCGLAAYGICLPLVGVGLLLALLLTPIDRALTGGGNDFEPFSGPAHPVVLSVAQGDIWVRLQVLLLACVVAPLVEETMFRGVLYRNLREATCRLGRGWSFLVSATVVSFLFAAVHPQGLVGIPVLMSLAYSFSVAREWRGTLLPGMVAHAVNNGAAMTFAILLLGD
jgi:membrane protease YdiL (CAAX protease family)